ncbi:MAG: MarR family winged helix-turn-helix transcriptional regulator [Arachnia sp.]
MDSNDPRWLSSQQQVTWRAWLRGTAAIQRQLDADLRRFGLNLAEYEIFVVLSEAPGRRMRMSDVAEAVSQSRSRLTHTVSRLESRGLVERSNCAQDGRGIWAGLTDAGYDALVSMAPHHVASVRRVFVDAVDAEDFEAIGRAMSAVLEVAQ